MKLNLKFVNKISKSITYNEIIFIKEKKLKNNHLKSLEKSIFSSKLTNATFCAGSFGDLTIIDEASKGTDQSGPKISLIAFDTSNEVLKSPW